MTTNKPAATNGHGLSRGEEAVNFEKGRIKALQEERLHIQKKTFTKWMNSFLTKARMEVSDLFIDLADGRKLLKLLEIISGEKLGKPNNGKMRVHFVENVNKSLAFLHTKVRLESIGAEDIVDGNPRLILGLIWTIILRFQIQEIEIDVDEENESSEKKSAKDALLLWCQRKTNGYPNVNIQDFTGSWRNGLGFNALIHAHRPDLIDFESLVVSKHIDNLNNAFDVAENGLGIPSLLDAEDIDVQKPDEKSVLTYVASYYHTFARMKNEMKGGRRIANIVGQIMEADSLKSRYENLTSNLLTWIQLKIKSLDDRNFPNNLELIQKELTNFKDYRTVEKPSKYKEKSEIEVNYFNINTRLKELKQGSYNPPDGKLVHDVEKAWERLEKAEYRRETALRDELLRQTQLEQLAKRFSRKSDLREGYLKDMIGVLSDKRYGVNLGQVEATIKKHEAISADILAREVRCQQLKTMADYLYEQDYNQKEIVKSRADEIMKTWGELIKLLEGHKFNLGNYNKLMGVIREIDSFENSISDFGEIYTSDNTGGYVLGVEDLLQKQSLTEGEVSSMGEGIKKLVKLGQRLLLDKQGKEEIELGVRLKNLEAKYSDLVEKGKIRRNLLEDAQSYFRFVQDCEEEESWVVEKQRLCKSNIGCKDLRGVNILIGKHKKIMDELRGSRGVILGRLVEQAQAMASGGGGLKGGSGDTQSKDVSARINNLKQQIGILRDLCKEREARLNAAASGFQFSSDANEVDSWILEKRPLVESTDYGDDEPTALSLLQRHRDLQDEIIAYEVDIKSLNSQAEKLMAVQQNSTIEESSGEEDEEWVQKLQPQDYFEDEETERTEYKTVTEERAVPQVKALYPFSGQELEMAKGEVMFLLNKTNGDWWNVRKGSGQDGFVPANYIKEIEPKVVMVQVRKPETVKEMVKVKKTKMVLLPVKVKSKKNKSTKPKKISVSNRIENVNKDYEDILGLSKTRLLKLQDSIKLQNFYGECSDFSKWITEKELILTQPEPTLLEEKSKFEKFLTDLSASSKRLQSIDERATHLSNYEKVKESQSRVHKLYANLNKLKSEKEKSLEGASSVELFNRNCVELTDWIMEKMEQIDLEEIGSNLKTVQALQRKHLNLERELAPVGEKVEHVRILGDSVVKSYPSEKSNVEEKKANFESLWKKLQLKAVERRERLEIGVGRGIFLNSSKALLNWIGDLKKIINEQNLAKDVTTAEVMLKKHGDLLDDIKQHEDEFIQVIELGNSLLKTKQDEEIKTTITCLKEERNNLHRGWGEKGDWLQQVLDLQMFNREADGVEGQSNEYLKFLRNGDLGQNLDAVENLLKRHNEFENSVEANYDRLKLFSEMADKLIVAEHYDEKNIDGKRNLIIKNRDGVKLKGMGRKKELLKSLKFYEFVTDYDDMIEWIGEKKKSTESNEEDLKNGNLVGKKLKKHEAFNGELRANEGRLKQIERKGQRLIDENELKKPEIELMLSNLNEKWNQLTLLSEDKLGKLRQAEAGVSYYKQVDNVKSKLDDIEEGLKSNDLGKDRRACKELLKQHGLIENEMGNLENKIEGLNRLGEDMKNEGHFDGDNLIRVSCGLLDRVKNLKGPSDERRRALEELLKYYDFVFEIDNELGWIAEKMGVVGDPALPGDLHSANVMFKRMGKLQAEIENRKGQVGKVVSLGESMQVSHPERVKIKKLCKKLESAWKELETQSSSRLKRLELALKAEEYYYDAGEIEQWINEKKSLLLSKEYGRDKESSVKLLTKHKTLELEIDSYSGLVSEMVNQSKSMVGNPDYKKIQSKQDFLDGEIVNLKKLANERRVKLISMMSVHEYYMESGEFNKWIEDTSVVVESEDYGVDYEHLLILQGKFNDVKNSVGDGGQGRFDNLVELSSKIQLFNNSEEEIDEDLKIVGTIADMHALICTRWTHLLSLVEARDHKLQAAGEIHRFNRDVADALARIQEKLVEIPEGGGKDVNSCESMLRLHENFENDLLPLEAQLQVLVDDAVKLAALYPTNASNIKEEQRLVIENWSNLQNSTISKKTELQTSLDYHRFMSNYRDLTRWSNNMIATMDKLERSRDTAGAQLLMAEHERLKNEIEARSSKFESVWKLGKEIGEEVKVGELLETRKKLELSWNSKKIYLDQLIDLMIFLRDCQFLETIMNSQLNLINVEYIIDSVEQVIETLKKHEDLEKVVLNQGEKFLTINEQGFKLTKQGHFDSQSVDDRLNVVNELRAKVIDQLKLKRVKIEKDLEKMQFLRDIDEALVWIEDKNKEIVNCGNVAVDLEEKIKKLKKLEGFQAEINSNRGRIDKLIINQLGDTNLLKEAWENLLKLSIDCGKGLEEAQDILLFNNLLEKTEKWIREKEILVQQGEVGKDYEHCLEIVKKLDDVELRVDDESVEQLNSLGSKLANDKVVGEKLERLNMKWSGLKGGLIEYRKLLSEALEVHLFVRDCEDTRSRIKDKQSQVNSNVDIDLETVELLVRKQDGVEVEVKVLEEKVGELESKGFELIEKYQTKSECINNELEKLKCGWSSLTGCCYKRRELLTEALSYSNYLKKLKAAEIWVEDVEFRIESSEDLVQLKSEVESKKNIFDEIESRGKRDIVEGHGYAREIEKGLGIVGVLRGRVENSLELRKKKLDYDGKHCVFLKLLNEAENELENGEAFLNNEDLGSTVGQVDNLIRRHQNYVINQDKVNGVIKFVELNGLKENDRVDKLKKRSSDLENSYGKRTAKLIESKKLQIFLLNLNEVESWISEKISIASDENYLEMTNLQSKMQKHAAFESEVQAGENRVDSVVNEGNELVNKGHYANEEILSNVNELKLTWLKLKSLSELKKDRLSEAYQALLFNQNLEDLDIWMDELENQLESSDHGNNLQEVTNLIKKLTNLESQYKNHREQVENVKRNGLVFEQSNHFMKIDITEKVGNVIRRYAGLEEPLLIRRENLDENLKLFSFLRDFGEELEWIGIKLNFFESSDVGMSVEAVGILQKKFDVVELEVKNRIGSIENIVKRGMSINQLEKSKEIKNLYSKLLAAGELRKLKLSDSLKSQQFYAEVREAVEFINEKMKMAGSTDYGNDEDSVMIMIKKFDLIKKEVLVFEEKLDKIIKIGSELTNHFDEEQIKTKLSQLKENYSDLQKTCDKRKQRLSDSYKMFRFSRECSEILDWISEQMHIAGSEDYGRDVEHVEILIQKFEAFLITVNNAGDTKVLINNNNSEQLIEEGHPEPEKINSKNKEVKLTWDEFKELATARKEALEGALKVHTFDRTADETIQWIGEKINQLNSNEDYGKDLESIQKLIRKDIIFQRDLEAVKVQVNIVKEEGLKLGMIFPDAIEHIQHKIKETEIAVLELLEKSELRKLKLIEAEKLQTYFDEWRDLINYCNELIGKISSVELGDNSIDHGVEQGESILEKHREVGKGIDLKKLTFETFFKNGLELINRGHFMEVEIREKVDLLKTRWDYLNEIWVKRLEIYEQNLDCRKYLRDLIHFESWIGSRELELVEEHLGNNVREVEELIRKHEDFEKAVGNYEREKIELVQRRTSIEEMFEKMKMEENQREMVRVEMERVELVKRKERERIELERNRNSQPEEHSKKEHHHAWNIFGDRLRRGSDPTDKSSGNFLTVDHGTGPEVTRSESFNKLKPKRTPSFTTRRRTQSFRKIPQSTETDGSQTSMIIDGYLERKHELQSGGKRAAVRSWKSYYVVLTNSSINFYKDQDDYNSGRINSSLTLEGGYVEKAKDYLKRKFVWRFKAGDGGEWIFASESEISMDQWVENVRKIIGGDDVGAAETTPSGSSKKKRSHVRSVHQNESSTDEEEETRHNLLRPRSREPLYANLLLQHVQHEDEESFMKGVQSPKPIPLPRPSSSKPPIPPRSSSIILESPTSPTAPSTFQSNGDAVDSLQKRHSMGPPPTSRHSPSNVRNMSSFLPPPMSTGSLPGYNNRNNNRPVPNAKPVHHQYLQQNPYYNVYNTSQQQPLGTERQSTGSLPPNSSLLSSSSSIASSTNNEGVVKRRNEESSSESDSPAAANSNKKEKRSSGLMGLFKRKKATQL